MKIGNRDPLIKISLIFSLLFMAVRLFSQQPATLLDVIPVDSVVEALGIASSSSMNADSLAMENNGNLIFAINSACVELDAQMNIIRQYAPELTEANNVGFASRVSVNSSGIVYLYPASGSNIIKIVDDTGKLETISTDIQHPLGICSAFPDGSFFANDFISGNFYRILKGKHISLIGTEDVPKISGVIATAPNGAIWALAENQKIFIFSENGEHLDSIPYYLDSDSSLIGDWSVDPNARMPNFRFIDSSNWIEGGVPLKYEANAGKGFWWKPDSEKRIPFDYSIANGKLLFNTRTELSAKLVSIELSRINPFKDGGPYYGRAIAIYPDGSLIIAGQGAKFSNLAKYSNTGQQIWSLPLTLTGNGMVPVVNSCAFDPQTGFIYVADTAGRQLWRYYDADYCSENHIQNKIADTLISLKKDQSDTTNGIEQAIKVATTYEQAGSLIPALNEWRKVIQFTPSSKDVSERISRLQTEELKRIADSNAKRTTLTLNILGVESARPIYNKTMQLYERILSADPLDGNMRNKSDELKKLFNNKDGLAKAPVSPIEIRQIGIKEIFPSLLPYYQKNPIGTLSLTNSTNKPIENLHLTIAMAKYLDFPQESNIERTIQPGETINVNVFLTLNKDVLAVEEDQTILSRFTISCNVDGNYTEISQTKPISILRRTSLVWDDSGKIASFITINDPEIMTISHFAIFSASFGNTEFAYKRIVEASHIWDLLRLYGIKYVSEPNAPITQIANKNTVVDSVHLPVTTLLLHSGNCSDTTALFSSLLESAGIPTAIMTSPGHVFCAFDSGARSNDLWAFQAIGMEIINDADHIWIPIETTALTDGFISAWDTASKNIRIYKGNKQIEFLSFSSQRQKYPSIPVLDSQKAFSMPRREEISSSYDATMKDLTNIFLDLPLKNLENQLGDSSGNNRLKLLNKIGIWNARYGRIVTAEKTFRSCIMLDQTFVQAYINLANTKMLEKENDSAILILEQASEINKESTAILLRLAQLYLERRDLDKLKSVVQILRIKSPDLLNQNNYLVQFDNGSATRGDKINDISEVNWSEPE